MYTRTQTHSENHVFRGKLDTLSLCLVSSEMLPLGERSVGVGGVTVISGGNLVTVEGMKSFGMLGGTRERIRLGSGSFDCSLLAYCCWSERERTIRGHFSTLEHCQGKVKYSFYWNNINSIHVSCRDLFCHTSDSKGSDLDKFVRCYMWQFPPGTSLLLILALGIQWRVSSVDKGVTPAVGTKVPLGAPPAPLWAKTIQQNKC